MANTKTYNQGYQPHTKTTTTRPTINTEYVLNRKIKYNELLLIRSQRKYDSLWDIDSKEKHKLRSEMSHQRYMIDDYITKLKIYLAEKEAADNPIVFWPIQMRRAIPVGLIHEDYNF